MIFTACEGGDGIEEENGRIPFVPEITISPEELSFPVEGGCQEIAITANFEYEWWTNANWLTIKKSEKGIIVAVPNYTEVDERTADITILSEKYGISKVVNVTQGAFIPEIAIEVESLTYESEGGNQELTITANFEYEWWVPASWLTIEKCENGVNITATPNNNFEERTVKITISNKKYGISKAIAVTQNGISAKSKSVILYTSSDNNIITPYDTHVFGANIISNIYKDGQGLIIFDAPVTSIGDSAFYKCKSLTSVTIPNGVTKIGDNAFYNCTSLTRVDISDLSAWCKISFDDYFANPLRYGAKLYLNGSELTDITIPSDITEIKNYAFHGSSLKSVTIPNSVTSIGECAFRDCTSLTSITIPDSVTSIGGYAFYNCTSLTSVTIPDSVTSIGSDAFSDCTSLTSVTIGNSVTSIGGSAFSHCTSLTSITIPDSVTSIGWSAFSDCTSLTSVTIGDSVTKIGKQAFRGCTSLTSITIPDGVTSIGWSAFEGCSSLTSITIPDSVTSIGERAFSDCTGELIINSSIVETYYTYNYPANHSDGWLYGSKFTKLTIGDSVTKIGEQAFRDCTSLTSVTIGNSVTSIGGSAFSHCTSLTSITISNSVTSVGNYAFNNCSSLTSITIPDSVTSIGSKAFAGCSSLTSITIPNRVTSIENEAFAGCSSLTSVTIGNGVTSIGYKAFDGCTGELIINSSIVEINYTNDYRCPDYPTNRSDGWLYGSKFTKLTIGDSVTKIGTSAFLSCTSLTSVTISNSVTSIGNYAFDNCSSLTSITIPDSVTSIGSDAFYNCTSLTNVTIGNSVTSIGEQAFRYCTSLTSVTIGNGVTSIGDRAFSDCYSLTSIYCKPITPPTFGKNAFNYCPYNLVIYVPTESVNSYTTASGWKDNTIKGYDF